MKKLLLAMALVGCAPTIGVRSEEPYKYDALALARCAAQTEEAVIDLHLPVDQAKALLDNALDDIEAGKIPRCGLPTGNTTGR